MHQSFYVFLRSHIASAHPVSLIQCFPSTMLQTTYTMECCCCRSKQTSTHTETIPSPVLVIHLLNRHLAPFQLEGASLATGPLIATSDAKEHLRPQALIKYIEKSPSNPRDVEQPPDGDVKRFLPRTAIPFASSLPSSSLQHHIVSGYSNEWLRKLGKSSTKPWRIEVSPYIASAGLLTGCKKGNNRSRPTKKHPWSPAADGLTLADREETAFEVIKAKGVMVESEVTIADAFSLYIGAAQGDSTNVDLKSYRIYLAMLVVPEREVVTPVVRRMKIGKLKKEMLRSNEGKAMQINGLKVREFKKETKDHESRNNILSAFLKAISDRFSDGY